MRAADIPLPDLDAQAEAHRHCPKYTNIYRLTRDY